MSGWPFGHLTPRHYRTIAIDPPWHFSGWAKGRPQHYPRMKDEEIARLPISELAHPDGAHIFVWITSPIDGERFWFKIFPSWKKQGARYSGRAFIWVKTHSACERNGGLLFIHRDSLFVGTGFTTRKNAEDCLLFKVGKPKRLARYVREIIIAPRREHSRKPDEFHRRVEQFSAGPRCELFARESRAGWDVWGNETAKFDAEAAA